MLCAVWAAVALAWWLRDETWPGVIVAVLATAPLAGRWLWASLHLPHGDAPWQALLPGALLVAIFLWGAWKDARASGEPLRASYFMWMLGESVALALVFGVVVGLITARLLGTLHMLSLAPLQQLDTPTKLMVSLGAGLYEELLFRVILVSGLATFGRVVCGMSPRVAGAFAVVLGAAIFSAFHYIGAYGDVLTVQSFTFRMIAGLFFSALYLLRGFGIVAWTHALYDVFLIFA